MVTPIQGSVQFVGLRTRQSYSKNIYCADAVNLLVHWDAGQGASATSPEYWIAPEPVMLTDISLVTGMTVTMKVALGRNGILTGDMFEKTIHVSTIAQRPRLMLVFNQGDQIQLTELA